MDKDSRCSLNGQMFYMKTQKKKGALITVLQIIQQKNLNTKEKESQDEGASRTTGFTMGKLSIVVGFSADETTIVSGLLGAS